MYLYHALYVSTCKSLQVHAAAVHQVLIMWRKALLYLRCKRRYPVITVDAVFFLDRPMRVGKSDINIICLFTCLPSRH